MVLMN